MFSLVLQHIAILHTTSEIANMYCVCAVLLQDHDYIAVFNLHSLIPSLLLIHLIASPLTTSSLTASSLLSHHLTLTTSLPLIPYPSHLPCRVNVVLSVLEKESLKFTNECRLEENILRYIKNLRPK